MKKGLINLLLIPSTLSLLVIIEALSIQNYELAIASTSVASFSIFVYVKVNSKLDKSNDY